MHAAVHLSALGVPASERVMETPLSITENPPPWSLRHVAGRLLIGRMALGLPL